MEISWSSIVEIMRKAYVDMQPQDIDINYALQAFKSLRSRLYIEWYRKSEEQGGVVIENEAESEANWKKYALTLDPTLIKDFILEYQVRLGDFQQNEWIEKSNGLLGFEYTKVIAISHRSLSAPSAQSRIQVTVKPEYAGEALHKTLAPILQSYTSMIKQWKVLRPQDGAIGPDSAVMYLLKSVETQEVKKLGSVLFEGLRAQLRPLKDTKLFKVLSDGIYAFNIPSEDDQQKKLLIDRNNMGSAGDIMCSIIAKAVVDARLVPSADEERYSYYKEMVVDKKLPGEWVRYNLTAVLSSISWKLQYD